MGSNKRLGIHWGEAGFSFVEVSNETPTLTAFVPFPEQGTVLGVKNLSQEMGFLDVLQKTVRNKGFSTTETYLSLPSKDILIRWFMIPWMKTSDIQAVVSFEAKKYIPFDIEETAYTYYPATVTKDGVRQIGILFVAIRKSVFEKYVNVLIQAGLNVVYSEPGPMSLVRTLMLKRQINVDQVTAILRTSQDTGELIITSKGHVKFIRDFKIHPPQSLPGSGEPLSAQDTEDVLRARIFNEVRISFEFFSRQYSEEGVNKILILSSGLKQSFWTGLNEELGVAMEIIDPLREISSAEGMHSGAVNAFGVAIAGRVPSVIDFNLSERASQSVSLKKEEAFQKSRQLILPVIVGIASAALIALVFFLSGLFLDGVKADVASAIARVGSHVDMTSEDLSSKGADEDKRFMALQSLPIKARVTPLIIRFSKLLPSGVWVDSMNVSFSDTTLGRDKSGNVKQRRDKDGQDSLKSDPVYDKVSTVLSMNISGYIYLNDSNAEFGLANQFVNTIRKDQEFIKSFKNVKLNDLKADTYAKTKVMAFRISCEGK
jgi:Tfp pilus assembly PilM family ATPase